jgi:signal transduction histidine kinase
MADVSHELRTPLAVLRGELEALEDGIRAPTPASLRSLQAEVATLSKLVDDLHLLSLSELGALSYRKTGVDAGELLALSQLGALRRPAHAGHGVAQRVHSAQTGNDHSAFFHENVLLYIAMPPSTQSTCPVR